MKHFIDIEHIRMSGDNGLVKTNTGAFEVGDEIQITEKWDGSNASAYWDAEAGAMHACSRKQDLSPSNTLGGFYDFIMTLPEPAVRMFKKHPNFIVFGEWGNKNKIVYNKEFYKRWYVYDIYDTMKEEWLLQKSVKIFAHKAGLEYIHVLYEGQFISWEHCMTFMNSPMYGDRQEGIVVKNQTKLNDGNIRLPKYLKIVNDDFKETMKTKVVDLEALAEKERLQKLTETIVTRVRVEKNIRKAIDEGVYPAELTPEDMSIVARDLPRRLYNDCIKEEPEIVAMIPNFGKFCGSTTMKLAKNIILGE
jgi:hypothetical protein